MRIPFAVALLLAAAAPAAAQDTAQVERRVDRIEKELRAVQRKVFPGGTLPTVEPEITPQQQTSLPGVAGGSALADLTSRVDALERQIANLTGQTEENAHRIRQLEEALTRFRSDIESRIAAPTPADPAPEPDATPNSNASSQTEARPAATPAVEGPEEAYLAGYRLWEAGKFTEAQKALDAMVKKYPNHARASYAQNLLGRAYLDDRKPATAAKMFLANYQNNPRGERAADSLYFLGQSLVQLKKSAEACKVYDELQDVYGANMRDWVKQRLPKARTDAKCS